MEVGFCSGLKEIMSTGAETKQNESPKGRK